MRGIAIAAVTGALAACFSQPPSPGIATDGPSGSGGDGGGPGSSACPDGQTPVVFEAFDEGSATGSAACGNAGGNVTATPPTCGSLRRGSGVLDYIGGSNMACRASCTWNTLPQQNGVIVQFALIGILNGADNTTVNATWTASASRTTGLSLELGPMLDLTSNGVSRTRTNIDLSQAWWRIAPSSQSAMGGWFSSDGSAWTSAGTDPGTPPVAIGALSIQFESADVNEVKLDTIYLCP